MSTLGNVLWFIFCGFFVGLMWGIAGAICCITIIGIPVGLQCFKFAELSFFPFGRNIEFGSGTVSVLVNIFWLLFFGIGMALFFALSGLVLCLTVIGIPFGLQMFKFAKLALMPFGAKIVPEK